MTAARDCVMTIYHFGKTIEGIDTSFGKCLTLRDVIDTTQKREARKAFERAFPSYGDLRNAIAHSAERTNTTQMSHRHGKMGATTNDGQFSKVGVVDLLGTTLKITGEDPKFVVLEGMQGSTFITTWDGTMLACELTANAGQALDAVIDRYWEAFTVIINPPATHAPPSAESSPPSPRP